MAEEHMQRIENVPDLGTRSSPRVGVVERDGAPGSGEAAFDRLALFTGRPLYWQTGTVTSSEYAERVMRLFDWCVGLPDVQIGIGVRGLAQILKSVYSADGSPPIPPDLDRAFDRLLIQEGAPPVWNPDLDVKHWGRYAPELTRVVLSARTPGEQIWLPPAEVAWWRAATEWSLKEYSNWALDPAPLLRLLGRHRCMLFAPLNGPSLLDHLDALLDRLPHVTQEAHRRTLERFDITRETFADPRLQGACWSWQFLEFGTVGEGSTIYKPVLAFWNDWPSSPRWAPEQPSSDSVHSLFSSEAAADFLEDLFWKKLETAFSVARLSCGLGVAAPDIAEFESRAPVFYFASPVKLPTHPAEYVGEKARILQPLVQTCLATRDAVSREVAWGILEGSLVTLRRESSSGGSNDLWYLLLPASDIPTVEIEDTLSIVVSQLGYLEFSIGDEAQDVYTELESLQSQRALLSNTLGGVSEVINSALQLLPTVSRSATNRINEMIPRLHILFHRVGTVIEEVHNNTVQLKGQFDSYADGTEDYLRRQVTFAPFPYANTLSLLDALNHAYPYEYLRQPMKTHQQNADELQRRIQPMSDTLETLIELANLQAREQAARYSRLLGLLQALGLPPLLSVIGLASGLASILAFSGGGPTVVTAAGIAVGVISGALFFSVVSYGTVLFIDHHLPPRRGRFLRDAARFRELVELSVIRVAAAGRLLAQAAAVAALAVPTQSQETLQQKRAKHVNIQANPRNLQDLFQQLEQMDENATQQLDTLWKELKGAEQGGDHARGLIAWLRQVRVLEYTIDLFGFAPEIMPLPRALCVFRYKSKDFRARSVMSDTNFRLSLAALGFSGDQVRALDVWLSNQVNQDIISRIDVQTFSQALKAHGVTADPTKRTPERWSGPLVV